MMETQARADRGTDPLTRLKRADDVKEALGKINSRDRDAWAWVNPDGGHMAQSKNRPDGKIF